MIRYCGMRRRRINRDYFAARNS